MGIRFFCPQGHRLHVKTELAGKWGVCPECQARFQIPPQSDPQALVPRTAAAGASRPAGAPLASQNSGSNTAAPALSTSPQTAGTAPATQPATPSPLRDTPPTRTLPARDSSGGSGGNPVAPQVSTLAAFASPANSPQLSSASSTSSASLAGSSAAAPAATDPFAVETQWYVRPPTGGEFGPADSAVMRQWFLEGRVPAASLIWREGWQEWQPAGQVLAYYAQLATPPGQVEPLAGPLPAATMSPTIERHLRIRKARKQTFWLVVLLGLASVGLLVVLVGVLKFGWLTHR